jgi:hypothetical protein
MNEYHTIYNITTDKLESVERDNIIDKLYSLKYRIPTITEDKYADATKMLISKISNKIPLYDISNMNLVLVDKHNVYNNVSVRHFRFPNALIKTEVHMLKQQFLSEQYNEIKKQKIEQIDKMFAFLCNFDATTLYNTYVKAHYDSSIHAGKDLSYCIRASYNKYIPYLEPYYTTSEVIGLFHNMDFQLHEKDNILDICKKIQNNDINSNLLIAHLQYINQQDTNTLLKYYSFQGSSIMNSYLRNSPKFKYINKLIESCITRTYNIIDNAPAFDNDYYLYRFISNDWYLHKMKIGDVYVEHGFLSTSRDPFFKGVKYNFGNILMKIRIPKKKRGIALAIEHISHFPLEKEIIIKPFTRLKLVSKDDNCRYYSTHSNVGKQIITKYEFSYDGCDKLSYQSKQQCKRNICIDFIKIHDDIPTSINKFDLDNIIEYFVDRYVNDIFQIDTYIGNKKYLIFIEEYDSNSAYDMFYKYLTDNGFSMYVMDNNHNILITIEIGYVYLPSRNKYASIYVNNYNAHLQISNTIDMHDFLKFIASVGYYFNTNKIEIHGNYKYAHNKSQKINVFDYPKYVGTYCKDIYDYFKTEKTAYDDMLEYIMPNYDICELNRIANTNISDIISKSDGDIFYIMQNYLTNHKDAVNSFYVWLVDNRCYMVNKLHAMLHYTCSLFGNVDMLSGISYQFFNYDYLFDNDIIKYIPYYGYKFSSRYFDKYSYDGVNNEVAIEKEINKMKNNKLYKNQYIDRFKF